MSFSTCCNQAGWSGVRTLVGGGGEIFWTQPDWPWVPTSLLYNKNHVSFLRVKRMGSGVDHPPLSNAEVEYRYSYTSIPLSACLARYGTAFTILFWVIPQFSYLSIVTLMPFSVSLFCPFLLHGQTVTVASLLTSLTTSEFQILL
jgi:hypothetical protein